MKLTGIIEQVFGSRKVFRGYATMRTLVSMSKPSEYQRKLEESRLEEILSYLNNSPFKFFPELIFAWQMPDNEVLNKLCYTQQTGKISRMTEAGFTITKSKFVMQDAIDGNNPTTKVITIEFSDELIALKPLSRLDGNHRLSALEASIREEEENGVRDDTGNMVVPFSIILLSPEENVASKIESAMFYLINSKAKPLTSEESLRSIFENDRFDNTEKNMLLSIDTDMQSRLTKLVQFLKLANMDLVKEVFNDEIYSLAMHLSINKNISVKQLSDAIISINLLFRESNNSYKNPNIYKAFILYKAGNQSSLFEKFKKWIDESHLSNLDKLDATEIIGVYEELHKKHSLKVFVAMPYISFKRVNEFNTLFKEILQELTNDGPYNFELIPIMRFRGESQRIDARLIKCIRECDVFIADLTTNNDNVIFEIGMAEGLQKPMLLIKAEEDTDKMAFEEYKEDSQIPFDMDKLQYIPYSNSGYYNDIKSIVKNNLRAILLDKGIC